MRGSTVRPATWALATLALAAVALAAYMAATATRPVPMGYYTPALVSVGVLAVWPFALGWRPRAAPRPTCLACGTEWVPQEASAGSDCPACGAPSLHTRV